MNTQPNRLFLLDAYALIFRAYYALIKMPRMSSTGFNTSAIFGFVNTLEELLRKERPTHIAVCFDPAGPTFRNEAYAEYKGERESTPEDIKLSVPIIKEIVRAYNIPILEVEGFEADDVIGTMARKAEKEGFTTYMMTPDKDFGQLVSPDILQYKPSYRGQDFELRGEEEVCARYGIERTSQVIDLLALMGDKIDNIPGCPGVGEKTAVKLIAEFGSVENLLEKSDTLKGALRKKVEENKEQILFSKYLATIRTDVPIKMTPGELKRCPEDKEKLFAIFRELEFKTLIERVGRRIDAGNGAGVRPSAPAPAANLFDFAEAEEQRLAADAAKALTGVAEFGLEYEIVDSPETLGHLADLIGDAAICGMALIADGENDVTAKWLGTAVADGAGNAVWIPSEFEEGRAAVLDLMARGDIMKVSAESKRDYVLAARRRTDAAPALVNYYDVSLAHYLLQPERRHDPEILAEQYLDHRMSKRPVAPAQRGRPKDYLEGVAPELLAAWACERAEVAIRLRTPLEKEIEAESMTSLLHDVELPLSTVLADMELTGVRIDVEALNQAARLMEERIAAVESRIYELAGEVFNVGSPARVGEILFERLQLDPKARKTKTGQYSTGEEILEKLIPKHPIVALILEWRAMKKLLTTYLTALPASINPDTGRVHTNYNQTVTATGRISSSNPNLQNIPVRDDEGREIRRAFISDPGCKFLSADYSQIELRLVADFADDEIMLDAFRHDKDIHAITASKIYHKPVEDVTANERRNAKTANFGIIYGISAFGLSTRLGIPRSEAKEIIDNYLAMFPTVHRYMSESVEHARETGYVVTRMGRKRRLPDINSKNPVVRGYAERNAVNAPIQGSAADIIKVAMVNISRAIADRGLKSKMIMQVHDELNFNVPDAEVEIMKELVESCMEHAYNGRVRLTAECGVADNWLDAH